VAVRVVEAEHRVLDDEAARQAHELLPIRDAAEFAVGNDLKPAFLLKPQYLSNRLILHGTERSVVELALRVLAECLAQLRRAEQAPDVIGPKRRAASAEMAIASPFYKTIEYTAMQPRAAEPRKRRAAEIVAAAAKVFAQRGYHGASTQDIADVLGIRQASLYYYFESKEAALEAVCADGWRTMRCARKKSCAGEGGASDKVARLVFQHLAPMVERLDFHADVPARASLSFPLGAQAHPRDRNALRADHRENHRARRRERRVPRRSRRPHGDACASRSRQFGGRMVRPRARQQPRADYFELRRPSGACVPPRRSAGAASPALSMDVQGSAIDFRPRAARAPRARRANCGRLSREASRPVSRADLARVCGARSQAAHGFRSLGLAAGERVAIMGDACEEWLLADLGAQAAGAIVYGIYPTASSAELEFQMKDGGASIFVAADQEYVDRILPLRERLPALRRIIVIDASALFAYPPPLPTTFDELLEMGGERGTADLEALARELDPASSAFIVYTSGTSGAPERRARLARHASRGGFESGRALSDACRAHASHGRVPADVPHPGTRHRRHAAAAIEARAALRRGRRGPATDVLRSRADGALHGSALLAEVRVADPGVDRQHLAGQAHRL
jgi:AcrR family transcriptional regulator